MRFSVGKNVLLKELNLLQGIVEKKSTIPILSNVLIETVNESTISLVATDLDVSLLTECAAESVKPGSMVLQARKLFEIVRNLPDAEINVDACAPVRVCALCGSIGLSKPRSFPVENTK